MLAEGHTGPTIFVDTFGGFIRKSNLRRRSFAALIKKAGVNRIRFHDLRHTAATLLLGQNVHAKMVQEPLGHSSITMTLGLYSHVTPVGSPGTELEFAL